MRMKNCVEKNYGVECYLVRSVGTLYDGGRVCKVKKGSDGVF